MDQKTAAQGVRTYAKNAHTAFTATSGKLRQKLYVNPNAVDAVQDFEAFMYQRALAGWYQEALNLDNEGATEFDDAKVLDRIQDKRSSLKGWLLEAKSLQSGLYAVHQYHIQEAAKRFLSDTYFVEDIEEN